MAALAVRRYAVAERDAREALALRPAWTSALHVLARALFGLRRYDEAVAVVRDAIAAAPRDEYAEAVRHAIACRRRFSELIGAAKLDALLTPSAPGEAPTGLASTGEALFNRNWTLLGVPCVTLPAGTGSAGLPIGAQLVADYDQDESLLRVAHWAERALA